MKFTRSGSMTMTMAVLVAAAILSVHVMGLSAQSKNAATKSSSSANALRTADGHPDLSGTWTNGTTTAFERPVALGEKAFYTEGEAAEEGRLAAERRNAGRGARRP